MTLDRYDIAILNCLRADARMSWVQLAEQVSLSASAAQRRVQSLQEKGIIRHFTVALDHQSLGHAVRAFVQVKIARHDDKAVQQFRDAVLAYESVEACYKVSGNMDFMLNIVSEDLASFGHFLEKKILYLPSVMDAVSFIVLESLKECGQAVSL